MDLQQFCATASDPREYLRKPWRSGQWVFCTNGHLALRVPASASPEAGEGERGKVPDLGAMFKKWLEDRDCEFLVMPPLPEVRKCGTCAGTGKVWAAPCSDCKDGTFTHGWHEYDCKNCDRSKAGPGWIDADQGHPAAQHLPCDSCGGVGYPLRQTAPVQLGAAHYDAVYLRMFADLPQCRVCPGAAARTTFDGPPEAPGLFLFDGGHGLLMPTRP